MNKKKLIYLVGGIILLWPMTSLAATFIVEKEGAQAITNADIEDDLYIAGNNVSVTHNVTEDLFAGGNTVEINSDVGQDIYAGGNTVRVSGAVGDDLFAGGSTVRIAVSTVDDVFAGGQIVEVIGDNIEGSVYAGGQKVTIKGNIKGSVRVSAETINIKSGTLIEGDLITVGNNEPTVEDDVQINGERRHSLAREQGNKENRNLIMEWVTSVLVWFVVALVLTYLLPNVTKEVINTALTKGGKSLGIGFAWMALLIPTIILLLVTIVGWPLAIMVGVFTAGDLIVAIAYSAVLVGVWTMKKFGRAEAKISWQHVLLGVVIIRAINVIPVVGWLISVVITLMALGAVGLVLWEKLKKEKVAVKDILT